MIPELFGRYPKNYYQKFIEKFFYNKVGIVLSDLCCDTKNIQQSLLTYGEKINLKQKKNKKIKINECY